MKVIIDRFEEEFAVCEKEDRATTNIRRDKIPPTARAGDVLNIDGDVITVDLEATKQLRREVEGE